LSIAEYAQPNTIYCTEVTWVAGSNVLQIFFFCYMHCRFVASFVIIGWNYWSKYGMWFTMYKLQSAKHWVLGPDK